MLLNFAEMLLDVAQMLPNFLPEFHIRFQKLSKSYLELRKFADDIVLKNLQKIAPADTYPSHLIPPTNPPPPIISTTQATLGLMA